MTNYGVLAGESQASWIARLEPFPLAKLALEEPRSGPKFQLTTDN